jgi:hypothetical protein
MTHSLIEPTTSKRLRCISLSVHFRYSCLTHQKFIAKLPRQFESDAKWTYARGPALPARVYSDQIGGSFASTDGRWRLAVPEHDRIERPPGASQLPARNYFSLPPARDWSKKAISSAGASLGAGRSSFALKRDKAAPAAVMGKRISYRSQSSPKS